MRFKELFEDGRIVKGVNTTVDVDTNEIPRQAKKFGNTVDKDGRPPTLSKKVKGKSTNVLFNLGLAEGYKLQLERDKEMLVLNITDTASGKRTEVRGKPGYETGNYDPNDKLHMLLDKVGKSANIAELINGEVVTINPKHPDGASAKAATDKAYNENFADIEENFLKDIGANIKDKAVKLKNALSQEGGETAEMMDIYKRAIKKQASPKEIQQANAQFKDVLKMVGLGAFNAIPLPGASLLIIAVEKLLNKKGMSVLPSAFQGTESMATENFADGKKNEGAEITMWTNPKYQGADVDDKYYKKQPVKIVNVSKLTPFEPADKMDPKDNHDNMMKFVDKIKAGEKIKPIVVVPHEGKLLIVDGHHRYFAHLKAGVDKIRAVIADPKDLTWRDDVPESVEENFADGKKKGKSRPGRVKRSGASCNGSVTALRKRAKNSSGEKAKMYHWCANMKSGRKKK